MVLYRQTIDYASGHRETWLWHPARIVGLRLRMDIRRGCRSVAGSKLERKDETGRVEVLFDA